jgi:hypothetical protein
MASCGSPVKIFSAKPSILLPQWHRMPDANGLLWPEYNYVRGRVTPLMAQETVVAVPLREANLEMPTDPALQHAVLFWRNE